jgi:hypothetical protein
VDTWKKIPKELGVVSKKWNVTPIRGVSENETSIQTSIPYFKMPTKQWRK